MSKGVISKYDYTKVRCMSDEVKYLYLFVLKYDCVLKQKTLRYNVQRIDIIVPSDTHIISIELDPECVY